MEVEGLGEAGHMWWRGGHVCFFITHIVPETTDSAYLCLLESCVNSKW